MREEAGDREGAEALCRQAADHGNTEALYRLARIREVAGDREGAETLARQAADHGNIRALLNLALMWEEWGDREGAETLARRAADHGDTGVRFYGMPEALKRLWPHGLDPDGTRRPDGNDPPLLDSAQATDVPHLAHDEAPTARS